MNTLGYINSYLLKKLYANLKATIALLTPASPIRQAKFTLTLARRLELSYWNDLLDKTQLFHVCYTYK